MNEGITELQDDQNGENWLRDKRWILLQENRSSYVMGRQVLRFAVPIKCKTRFKLFISAPDMDHYIISMWATEITFLLSN